MSDHCGEPGYGVDGQSNDQFMMGRMDGVMNRGDYPINTAAIASRTPVKWNAGRTELEAVTAATDAMFGILVCDKPAGVTRFNVFRQGDYNPNLLEPVALRTAADTLLANAEGGHLIFFKQPQFGGAE